MYEITLVSISRKLSSNTLKSKINVFVKRFFFKKLYINIIHYIQVLFIIESINSFENYSIVKIKDDRTHSRHLMVLFFLRKRKFASQSLKI